MVRNELLMQFQADLLDRTVLCPRVTETTALGAAYAAGLAVGYWESRERTAAQLERGAPLVAGHGRSDAGSGCIATGRRPSVARWTGSILEMARPEKAGP